MLWQPQGTLEVVRKTSSPRRLEWLVGTVVDHLCPALTALRRGQVPLLLVDDVCPPNQPTSAELLFIMKTAYIALGRSFRLIKNMIYT